MRVWPSNRRLTGMLGRFLLAAFASVGAFMIFIAAWLVAFGHALDFGKCHFNVIGSRPSPNAERAVIVYNKVCNDVYQVTTQASLAADVDEFKESPQDAFFRAIDIDYRAVSFDWLDENRLLVEMRDNIEIEKALLRAGDVEIEYR